MTAILAEGNSMTLTFPKSLLSEKQLARLVELLEFQLLVEQNRMTGEQANLLADEVKSTWWLKNRDRILDKNFQP